MKVDIYLKENYGQITKTVPAGEIESFINEITIYGFTQIIGKQHDYYPPSMILRITWEQK